MIDNSVSFSVGKKVQHIYTKEDLWMLKEGREQILCRTKDLREIWFYPYELEDVEESKVFEHKTTRRFL